MRLKHTVQVQLALDTNMKRALFKDDQTAATIQTDTFASQVNSVLLVSATSQESLSFGDVTIARGLYLELSGDAKVYLNGSTDAIQMRKASDTGKAKLFLECEITEVSVKNEGETDISGVYVCWGDPIA